MFTIFFMVSILLIAISLLCVAIANFSLKEKDNIPEKERLISHGIKDQVINPVIADNLIYLDRARIKRCINPFDSRLSESQST
jgi:hypothetical protein